MRRICPSSLIISHTNFTQRLINISEELHETEKILNKQTEQEKENENKQTKKNPNAQPNK